jgi:hypothetical protein
MSRKSTPAVVAELGRPETPEETAARKAESSRNHRTRQTVNNLVYSLLATLAVVAVIVLMVPRDNSPAERKNVDYAQLATEAAGSEPDPLVTPKLPAGWTSNAARLDAGASDGVDSWYIGLITPDEQYIALTQGFKANDTWIAGELKNSIATGTRSVDGVRWTVYDNRRSSRDVGDVEYAMVAESGASTYILYGTATTADFRTVARALAPQIRSTEKDDTL